MHQPEGLGRDPRRQLGPPTRGRPTSAPGFLDGALTWLTGGHRGDACGGCGYRWDTPPETALGLVADAPARYAALLAGRDGMAAPDDGGWNATAYVWHLVDLARSWAERWAQIEAAPGSRLVGWDPDVLAEARGYRRLATAAALWALPEAVDAFVRATRRVGLDARFDHADWGAGCVADAVVWLAHEFTHHQLDVAARAR